MVPKFDRVTRMDGRCATVFAAAAAIGASFYVFLAPDGKEKKKSRRDRPPGLVNLGNTCFMNSILQGIAFLPSFVAWLEDFSVDDDGKTFSSLGKELRTLVTALNTGCFEGDDVINPDFVLNALGSHGWVIPTDQQDAHEFFHVLSSTLNDEMGDLPNVMDLSDIAIIEKTDDSIDDNKSMVHRNKVSLSRKCKKLHLPFHGLLASQLVCKQCATKCPVKFDSYDSLSLSLPTTFQKGLRLEDLLRRFVCSETVDAVECHGCQQRQNTDDSTSSIRTTFIKRLTLGKLPQCLCFHIQRTYWHSNGIPFKNNSFIKFPEFLNMKPFLYEPIDSDNFPKKDQEKEHPSKKLGSLTNGGLRLSAANGGDFNDYLDELVTSFAKSGKKSNPLALSVFHYNKIRSPGVCTFDTQNRLKGQSTGQAVFKLMAVIVHMGTVDDGHYITYRRFEMPQGNEQGSKWLYTSDELVEVTSRDQALSSCAYMLFYERANR